MKALSNLFILFCSILFFSGCYSDKDRLSHKWVVNYVQFIEPDPMQVTSTNQDEYWKMMNERQGEFFERIYDLKKDGSFTMSHKDKNISGTWDIQHGVVIFSSENREFEQWRFHNDKIEIGHDTSLSPMTNWRGDKNYTQLSLHPAPGESVKTDF